MYKLARCIFYEIGHMSIYDKLFLQLLRIGWASVLLVVHKFKEMSTRALNLVVSIDGNDVEGTRVSDVEVTWDIIGISEAIRCKVVPLLIKSLIHDKYT